MEIVLKKPLSTDELVAELNRHFPSDSVKVFGRKKKIVVVARGTVSVRIIFKEDPAPNQITAKGDLNAQHPLFIVALIGGILLGMIGVLLTIGVLYLITNNARKMFTEEITQFLQQKYT